MNKKKNYQLLTAKISFSKAKTYFQSFFKGVHKLVSNIIRVLSHKTWFPPVEVLFFSQVCKCETFFLNENKSLKIFDDNKSIKNYGTEN